MIIFRTFYWVFVLFFIVVFCNTSTASVNFSSPALKDGYTSAENWPPRGMKELYWLTSTFLHAVKPSGNISFTANEFYKALVAPDPAASLLNFGSEHWRVLVKHHWIVVALAALFLLLGALCLLLGLYLCCCRCCKRRETAYKKWRDGCRMFSWSVLISCLVIVSLFGLVASFVVNIQLERGIDNLSPRLHAVVNDVELFRNNTFAHLSHLFTVNFREFNASVVATLDKNDDMVHKRLDSLALAFASDAYVDQIRNYGALVQAISKTKGEIDGYVSALNGFRQRLLQSLASCDSTICLQVRNELKQSNSYLDLSFVGDFNLPPALSIDSEIAQFSSVIDNDFYPKIRSKSDSVRQRMEKISVELVKRLSEVESLMYSVDADIGKAHDGINTSGRYISKYSDYRYYAFFLVSSVVALVVGCMILGLFCGLCGRRPDAAFDNDTCSRASGSKFLMTGVFLFCLFGVFLFVSTAVLFIFGSSAQFYVCDNLSDPLVDSEQFSLIGVLRHIYPQLDSPSFQLGRTISDCHLNRTVYQMFDLEEEFQLQNINRSVNEIIDSEADNASQFFADLDNDSNSLRLVEWVKLLDTLTFNVSLYDWVVDRVDSLNFDPAIDSLIKLSRDHPQTGSAAIGTIIDRLNELKILVSELRTHLLAMKSFLSDLDNQPNLRKDISELKERIESALTILNRGAISGLVANFADDLKRLWIEYFNLVSGSIEKKVGHCGPLSGAYNATTVALCNSVLGPINGFWASIGWCLILLLVCVFFSLFLAPLYRKSEFLSDTLLNDQRRNGRVKKRRTASSSEYSGMRHRRLSNQLTETGPHSRAESPPYIAIPARGRDLALVTMESASANTEPKAPTREDLSEGPPGYSYLAGDVEFERPPPYFYPGAVH